jgi:hypothetical protein
VYQSSGTVTGDNDLSVYFSEERQVFWHQVVLELQKLECFLMMMMTFVNLKLNSFLNSAL